MTIVHRHTVSLHALRPAAWFRLLLLLPLLLTCPGAWAQEPKAPISMSLVGTYSLRGRGELRSELRLHPDGTYRFALTFAPWNERDEGTWRLEGTQVLLISTAPATDPRFELLSSSRAEGAGVRVSFEGKDALRAAELTDVSLRSGELAFGTPRTNQGYQEDPTAKPPIYEIRFRLENGLRHYPDFNFKRLNPTHNRFTFKADLGNFGWARFQHRPLELQGSSLVMAMAPDEPLRYKLEGPPPPQESLVGDYLLRGQMEVGSGLRLKVNGTYEFFLAFGNVDERDQGTWRLDGSKIVLDSTAPATDPSFELSGSSHEDVEGVQIRFEGPGAAFAARIADVSLRSGNQSFSTQSGDPGQLVAADATPPIHWVSLHLPGGLRQYTIRNFQVSDPTHNRFVFKVDLGNWSWTRFQARSMDLDDGELLLSTGRESWRYRRQAPAPTKD